jgi:transposase InsO family protein
MNRTFDQGRRIRHWTLEIAQNDPSVTRDGDNYLHQGRLIVFTRQQAQKVLEAELEKIPESTGYLRFFSYIRQKYEGIRRVHVQEFLKNSEAHQLYTRRHKPSTTRVSVPKRPGVRWQTDIAYLPEARQGSKALTGICVIIDLFSKYVRAYAITSESAAELQRVFQTFFKDIGPEKAKRVRLVSADNGPGFGSKAFKEWMAEQGVKIVNSKAYSPQSQGTVERMNQTLKKAITSAAETKHGRASAWPLVLDMVVDFVNRSYTRVLKKRTPEEVFGDEDPDPEVAVALAKEGGKRRNSRLYTRLHAGQAVRVALAVVGDAATRGAIKQGTRKGYLAQWSREIFTIKSKHGESYSLEEAPELGRVDRLNLLLLPSKDPHRPVREQPEAAPRTGPRPPPEPVLMGVRPVRARRAPQAAADYMDPDDVEL